MAHVSVRAIVRQDNTGILVEIPIILTATGPLDPLVDYLLEKSHVVSYAWMQKLVQAVGLLLDYMDANRGQFESPGDLFKSFVQRLYSGTIGEDGRDPSGLYWSGKSAKIAKRLGGSLTEFSDWLVEKRQATPLNPWHDASTYEERLNWAAWHSKRDQAFLGHTWDVSAAALSAKRARQVLFKRTPIVTGGAPKAFSEERIVELLTKGFVRPGKAHHPLVADRLNLRDILITYLMHFGGLRMSEPFHLYVHDVMEDPLHPGRALVRIFHPSLGKAPLDWRDATGVARKCDRQQYLAGKHQLRPRNAYPSTHRLHAGWKGAVVDSDDGYIDVHWFPAYAGEMFLKLWLMYMAQRAAMKCRHPFAFVSLKGEPYSIDAFERAHKLALERIGLASAKHLATSPHSHRHAFGQRMAAAQLHPKIIQRALHHASEKSQDIYTGPSRERVNEVMNEVMSRMEKDGHPLTASLAGLMSEDAWNAPMPFKKRIQRGGY